MIQPSTHLRKQERRIVGSPIDPVIEAYSQDLRALLLTGPRHMLDDLIVCTDGMLRTLKEELRRELASRTGLALMEYYLAGDLDAFQLQLDVGDRQTIERVLRRFNLWADTQPRASRRPARVLRNLGALLRTPIEAKWSDGRPMRFAVLLRFFEHLAPGGPLAGAQGEEQLVAIELASELARSLALRQSGNLLLVQGREGLIDELVCRALHHIRLPLPDLAEKQGFLETALGLYQQAAFEDGLTPQAVARLTTRLPNRSLEALLRASHRQRRPITVRQVVEQKARDIEEVSEGTLALLDTGRVRDVKLCGRNAAKALYLMERFGEALLAGDPSIPSNVLLAGAPGSGKTDLALLTARRARATAYQLVSPKNFLVGETERRANIQMRLLQEAGGIGFVDEITEAFPMQRTNYDGDSGASRAVMAAMLTWLSDDSRRGEVLLIATTNCPWRISRAMAQRFTVIPVLQPLPRDYPDLVAALARRIDPAASIDPNDSSVREAAAVYAQKGASPRDIRATLSQVRLDRGPLTAETVLAAAHDLLPPADRLSSIYADLWAIHCCTLRSFLPWSDDPRSYPFPDYLEGIVDATNGQIDRDSLSRRIHELEPHANV